jgi:hypothetical protein
VHGVQGEALVALEPVVKGGGGRGPADRVGELDGDALLVVNVRGDVRLVGLVRDDVDLDDAVPIVLDVKAHVGEDVVAELVLTPLDDLLHLSDESPHWQVVVVHLEVPVVLDGLASRRDGVKQGAVVKAGGAVKGWNPPS